MYRSAVIAFKSYYPDTHIQFTDRAPLQWAVTTRSHPEMVGDMSHVTLNFDLSKTPFVHF